MKEFKAEISYQDAGTMGYPWVVDVYSRSSENAVWVAVSHHSGNYTTEKGARRGAQSTLKALRKQEAYWPSNKVETIK